MPDRTHELAQAVRDLIDVVRTADLVDADLDHAIAAIRSVEGDLRPRVVAGLRMQAALRLSEEFMERRDEERHFEVVDREPADFFPYSPVIGERNPVSPPVHMWKEHLAPDSDAHGTFEIHGAATLGAPYNGPPGSVHGGVIAAVFDELLGSTAVVNEVAGFTGTLTVVYRSPTPLDEPLTMRAWIDRVEGRKTFAAGELHHAGTLCAEAEGIFIGFDPGAFAERRAANLG